MTTTATPPTGGSAPDTSDVGAYAGEEMSLVEHLRELRSRLVKSVLAIVGGLAVGFAFRNPVLDILREPYCNLPVRLRGDFAGTGECTLLALRVMDAFFVSLKAAAIVAVVLAAPVVCYQLWRFITPGLRPVERRYALPFILITQILFAAGAVFSYFLIPRALEFLLAFAGDNITTALSASEYLTFILHTMLAFGIAFEFPVVLVILSLMGVIGSAGMRKYRRHALFGVFVAAAIITPTQDPATMAFMAAPLAVFYEGSIVAARIIERRRGAREAVEAVDS